MGWGGAIRYLPPSLTLPRKGGGNWSVVGRSRYRMSFGGQRSMAVCGNKRSMKRSAVGCGS